MQRMPLAARRWPWTPVSSVEGTAYIAFAQDSAIWWSPHLGSGTHRRTNSGRDSLVFPRNTISQILPGGHRAIGVQFTTASNSGTAQLMDLESGVTTTLFDTPIVEVRYTMGYLVYVLPDNTLATDEPVRRLEL